MTTKNELMYNTAKTLDHGKVQVVPAIFRKKIFHNTFSLEDSILKIFGFVTSHKDDDHLHTDITRLGIRHSLMYHDGTD